MKVGIEVQSLTLRPARGLLCSPPPALLRVHPDALHTNEVFPNIDDENIQILGYWLLVISKNKI